MKFIMFVVIVSLCRMFFGAMAVDFDECLSYLGPLICVRVFQPEMELSTICLVTIMS